MPENLFAVDLVRDDGTSDRYSPGPSATPALPLEALPEHVGWSRLDPDTGVELVAFAAVDSTANRSALLAAGWQRNVS